MSEYEDFKKRYQIEQIVYERMCSSCPSAKICHEECETCKEFDEEVERLETKL